MRVITVARKPLAEGTVAENALAHGTGGINIEASRVGDTGGYMARGFVGEDRFFSGLRKNLEKVPLDKGRWPANVILDERVEIDGAPEGFFFRATPTTK